jgi:hypothetical protein
MTFSENCSGSESASGADDHFIEDEDCVKEDIEAIYQHLAKNIGTYISDQFRKISIRSIRPRKPAEYSNGQHKGEWIGDSLFVLDNSFIPAPKYNPSGKTIGEITHELQGKYGIIYQGIIHNGFEADFSPLSIASIDLATFFDKKAAYLKEKQKPSSESLTNSESNRYVTAVENYYSTFKKIRSQNFGIADRIAAELQLPIPGLPSGYTAAELSSWRSANHFTWDEGLDNGYILIPSIIHSLHAHNGLVAFSQVAFKERKKLDAQALDFSMLDENSIISIEDLLYLDCVYQS